MFCHAWQHAASSCPRHSVGLRVCHSNPCIPVSSCMLTSHTCRRIGKSCNLRHGRQESPLQKNCCIDCDVSGHSSGGGEEEQAEIRTALVHLNCQVIYLACDDIVWPISCNVLLPVICDRLETKYDEACVWICGKVAAAKTSSKAEAESQEANSSSSISRRAATTEDSTKTGATIARGSDTAAAAAAAVIRCGNTRAPAKTTAAGGRQNWC